ncbi:MAG TPA: CoA pyrophosphatase [Burkholderiaceae bacterium]|nr:CoA pyrophosphatase [Burkholderiaceae bacterium]
MPAPDTPGSSSDRPAPIRRDEALRASLARRLAGWPVRAIEDPGLRRAAVVLAIVDAGHGAALDGLPTHARWSDEAALLLTRRTAHLNRHAGQWALPGGRLDPGETAERAALRELEEELGLEVDPGAVLGRLDDYATRSGFAITPVVVWAGPAPELRPSPEEVASAHRVPLVEWLRADAPILDAPHEPDGPPVLRMPLGDDWVAAPTAAMIYQLREVLLLGRDTRVAHFDQPRFTWR